MKNARLFGLLLIAILATSLLSVATASAGSGNPLFIPANGQGITGVSGPSTLKAGTADVIACQKDTATGNITSSLLAGKVFVHYLECTSLLAPETARCTVRSVGAPEPGLIITKELHGILGLLLPSLETGILFLPTVAPIFVEIAAGEKGAGTQGCTPETKVTGTVAGLVTPVGTPTLKGEIRFPSARFTEIDLTHGLGSVVPKIVAFGVTSTLEQTENVTFGEATEVT